MAAMGSWLAALRGLRAGSSVVLAVLSIIAVGCGGHQAAVVHGPWQALKACLGSQPLLSARNGGGTLDLADHAIRHLSVLDQVHGFVANFDLVKSNRAATLAARYYNQATRGNAAGVRPIHVVGPLLYQLNPGIPARDGRLVATCSERAYGGG